MSVLDWAAVAEIVGVIAIVVTLFYLAAQIRLNSTQIRNDAHAGITTTYNDLLGQLLADDLLFKLVVRGCQDWESLNAFEQSRFHIFFHQHLMHFRLARSLIKKGAIDEDVYSSIEELHLNVLANPGARTWWEKVGTSLVEDDLKSYISRRLAETERTATATINWDFYDPKNWVNDGDE